MRVAVVPVIFAVAISVTAYGDTARASSPFAWEYEAPGEYDFDPRLVEISEGSARLVRNDPGKPFWRAEQTPSAGRIKVCRGVAADSGGDTYAAVLDLNTAGATDFRFELFKYDGEGDLLGGWPKEVSRTTENNSDCAVAVDGEDNVYVAGQQGLETKTQIKIHKYDSEGNRAAGWPVTVDPGTDDDRPSGLSCDAEGNLLLCGQSKGEAPGGLIVKFRPDGSIHPGFPILVPGADYMDVAVCAAGNIYVAGRDDLGVNSAWLIDSYTGNGDRRRGWPQKIREPGRDGRAMGIAVDSSSRIVAGGFFRSGATVDSGVLAWFSPKGALEKTMEVKYENRPAAILGMRVDETGYVLAAGSVITLSGSTGLACFKFDQAGKAVQGWPFDYSRPGSAGAMGRSVSAKPDGNVVVGGDFTVGGSRRSAVMEFPSAPYSTGMPAVESRKGIDYDHLAGFLERPAGGNRGTFLYQLSPDGADWYYPDNGGWQEVDSPVDGGSAALVNAKIGEFADSVGAGRLFVRALLRSDGSQACALDAVEVDAAVGLNWYLAEGYTGDGNYPGESFDTYVLIENPNDTCAEVAVEFHLPESEPVQVAYAIAHDSRFTIHLDEIPGLENTPVSTMVKSTNGVPVYCERSMYFDYYGRVGGHDSIGVTHPAANWYLAEGYTGGAFDTWVLMQNPSDETLEVRATFMRPDADPVVKDYSVEAGKRFTIEVDAIEGLESTEVSTKLESQNGVGFVCERAMYFDYNGWTGGHGSIGANRPSTEWYLAEGCTAGDTYQRTDFDTYVLVGNPSGTDAEFEATFMMPGGATRREDYGVEAGRRMTISLDQVPGLESPYVSTRIASTNGVPLVCERSMYFDYYGRTGGHNSIGVTSPHNEWFLAEGYTCDDAFQNTFFDTYLLIQNPEDESVVATVVLYSSELGPIQKDYLLEASERFTLQVDSVPGLEEASVSASVTCPVGRGIVCERAMYFDNRGKRGGHDSIGYTIVK
jgi:hypothetical protein